MKFLLLLFLFQVAFGSKCPYSFLPVQKRDTITWDELTNSIDNILAHNGKITKNELLETLGEKTGLPKQILIKAIDSYPPKNKMNLSTTNRRK